MFGAVIGALVSGPGSDSEARNKPRVASFHDIEIRLVAGPIHYDFLLPLNHETRIVFGDLKKAGLDIDHPRAKWLVMGWGAKGFYTETGSFSDLSARVIAKATFGDHSVMRVDLAGVVPADIKTISLKLSSAQYSNLLTSIADSFAGKSRALDHPGLSGTDLFFHANGHFNIFNTCNVWIGQQLRAAGLRFGAWTPTPYAVTLSHWFE